MKSRKRMINIGTRLALLSFVVIGAFAAAGCIFDSPVEKTPIGDPVVPDSPANVVYNLEIAYNNRDINLYKQCLSPNFTFYFNQSDVGTDIDGYIIPSSWGYEDDWTATQNMFTQAYDISMTLSEGDIEAPPSGATTYTAEDIGVSLLVMIDENNGFIANKGTLTFNFETYDSNGQTYWRIKDWRDFTYS